MRSLTTPSLAWPLFADAGSTKADPPAFRNHVDTSTRRVTAVPAPALTVIGGANSTSCWASRSDVNTKSLRVPAWLYVPATRIDTPSNVGLATMKAASSDDSGLWILNSSLSYCPGGALTLIIVSVAVVPRGNDTRTAPVSNSSHPSSLPTVSH